ncbi:hypothetical protein EJ04DRAFT_598663 [Polyplosphaeria fusca]|uniref:Uncharacterized protein n=1 Tax=Polyplosphaeria fusca TaxID=682080 RepID=A0A9P4QHZ2_9PLEO|nr:hypothetical protein EJ04DRAFT_598961 [Polyplosphaeria fusca]KAF2726620.1 hypothetical protein EJ04DRAFT_598663 [Polyplosphaeria fusca]
MASHCIPVHCHSSPLPCQYVVPGPHIATISPHNLSVNGLNCVFRHHDGHYQYWGSLFRFVPHTS